MKRYLTILFSFLYLFLAMGISVNLHYCHGEVDSVSFFSQEGSCCCHKAGKPSHCCFDENYKYELNSEQFFSSLKSYSFSLIEVFTSECRWFHFKNFKSSSIFNVLKIPLFLIDQGVPIRLLQSVFRL